MRFKKILKILFLIMMLVIFGIGCSKEISWKASLYTPTSIEKIDDLYFIVDCWHHRVIYNDNLEDKISDWDTLSENLEGPHSIVSDNEVFLVDNTEKNEIQVFKRENKKFILTQIVKNVGERPHKIIYDKETKLFYSIASISSEIVVLENVDGVVKIKQKTKLNFLENAYVRSIVIIEDKMYFIPGPGKIISAEYKDGKFNVIDEYKLSENLQAINHIDKIGSYYYASLYTTDEKTKMPKIVRFKNFGDLQHNKYEDLTDNLGIKGVPYYFSKFDEKIFITEIDSYSAIKSFKIINDKIEQVTTHYDSGKASKESKERKESILK